MNHTILLYKNDKGIYDVDKDLQLFVISFGMASAIEVHLFNFWQTRKRIPTKYIRNDPAQWVKIYNLNSSVNIGNKYLHIQLSNEGYYYFRSRAVK